MTPIAQLCHSSSSLSYHLVLNVASELGAPIGRSTAVAEQHRVPIVAEDLGAKESGAKKKKQNKLAIALAKLTSAVLLLTDYADRPHGPVGRRDRRR